MAYIYEKHLEHYFIESLTKQGLEVENQVRCDGGRCDVLQPGKIVWEVKRGHLTRETLEIAVLQARRYADAMGIDRIGIVCNSCDKTFLKAETFDLVVIPMKEVEEWWCINFPPDLEAYDQLCSRYEFLKDGHYKEVLNAEERSELFAVRKQIDQDWERIQFWKQAAANLLGR